MTYAARLERIHRLIEPIVNGADPPKSAFIVPGRLSESADYYSAAHDAILLNDYHRKATTITENSLSIKDFTKLGLLGEGQFGKVHAVRCSLNGANYAMKSIEKYHARRAGNNLSLAAERLLHILAGDTAPVLFAAFQTPTTLYLVTELAPFGSLADHLDEKGTIPEFEIQWWASQLLQAVEWIHFQGFTHRDIKPGNVVISHRGALLTDFGSAASLQQDNRLAEGDCVSPIGTPDYIAPEILQYAEAALMQRWAETTAGLPTYTAAVDYWSLGVTIFELAVGRTPFYAADIRDTYAAILALRPLIKATMSTELTDLVQGLLTTTGKRIGASELRQHAFMTGNKGSCPILIDDRMHTDESDFATSSLSISLESVDPSITQIAPTTIDLQQWYGWTRLPSFASMPSGIDAGALAQSPKPIPRTPHRANPRQVVSSTYRRRELLQCVQESAKKSIRQGKRSASIAQDLEDLTDNLDDLTRRLQSIKVHVKP